MGKFSDKIKDLPLGLSFDDVLLVPQYSDVRIEEIDLSTKIAEKLTLRIPIISSPMDTVTGREMVIELGRLGGLGVLPRTLQLDHTLEIVREALENSVPVAAAVGPFDDNRVKKLAEEGVSLIVVDTAHGHSKNVVEATRRYSEYGVPVMAGNIVTGQAAEALINAGASSLRVGIGPGHACTTREVAGVGVPQLTAISWVAEIAKERGVSVIADGGIEKTGDIVKALAAGADAVMLGYLLAGVNEAPGRRLEVSGRCYKEYRGMGSLSALKRGSKRYGEFKKVPEGIEGYVECRGPLKYVISNIVGGLKQGMGYVGARNIRELQKKAVFVRLSEGGIKESRPRGILREVNWI